MYREKIHDNKKSTAWKCYLYTASLIKSGHANHYSPYQLHFKCHMYRTSLLIKLTHHLLFEGGEKKKRQSVLEHSNVTGCSSVESCGPNFQTNLRDVDTNSNCCRSALQGNYPCVSSQPIQGSLIIIKMHRNVLHLNSFLLPYRWPHLS